MSDVCEDVVRQMVRDAFSQGKMFEFIMGFDNLFPRDQEGNTKRATKYHEVAQDEYRKIIGIKQ